jgi:hypothetical protein
MGRLSLILTFPSLDKTTEKNMNTLHLDLDLTQFAEHVVEHVLKGSGGDHIVVGPLVQPLPNNNRTRGHDYFTVASSGPIRGFRLDSIAAGTSDMNCRIDGQVLRANVLDAFARKKGLVVHDIHGELYMTKLCERLWPCERTSGLRKVLEKVNEAWIEKAANRKAANEAAFQIT